MKREDAIRNVAIALGWSIREVERVIERQGESINQLGNDMDRLVEVFGEIKKLAKSEPRKPKHPTSPYAKFDKFHKKKKK